MKQKQDKLHSQHGFTLVELLTVMGIMVLLLGALVVDFSNQRANRNVLLTKNEIATNLRKVQSYMLSSKNLPTGQAVKYYIATFNDEATTYTIDAVDSTYTFHPNLETVKLPSEVKISEIKFAPTNKPDEEVCNEKFGCEGGPQRGGAITPLTEETFSCMQIIFSAPFGKMYTHGASTCGSSIKDILRDPVQRASLSEKTAQIYFSKISGSTTTNYLEVNPITGQMTAY